MYKASALKAAQDDENKVARAEALGFSEGLRASRYPMFLHPRSKVHERYGLSNQKSQALG